MIQLQVKIRLAVMVYVIAYVIAAYGRELESLIGLIVRGMALAFGSLCGYLIVIWFNRLRGNRRDKGILWRVTLFIVPILLLLTVNIAWTFPWRGFIFGMAGTLFGILVCRTIIFSFQSDSGIHDKLGTWP